MSVKLLTEHHLEFLSLKGGCKCPSESKLVKIPHFWKSSILFGLTSDSRPHLVDLQQNTSPSSLCDHMDILLIPTGIISPHYKIVKELGF